MISRWHRNGLKNNVIGIQNDNMPKFCPTCDSKFTFSCDELLLLVVHYPDRM